MWAAKSDADAHVAEGVFEDQIPADDPGDQFAQRGVGVGVGRAGDGDHGGQFGVAKAGEGADDGHQNQRKRQRRSGSGPSGERRVLNQVVEQRGVFNARHIELLAGHGGADDGKDAGADDRSDAQRGQRPWPQGLLEGVLGLFRLLDQLIDGLAGNKLSEQDGPPHPARGGNL